MATSMFKKIRSNERAQAMVEFALVAGVLLAFLFLVIEAGRVFQAWVTVTNAARNGARFAITGQYNETGVFLTPECPFGTPSDRWQVCSVKDEALRTASGLNIEPTAAVDQPRAFGTQVCIPDACPPENVGLPGEPTRVRVFYNVEIVTPFFRPITEFIRVTGQVEVVTENYDQVSPNEIIITDVDSGGAAPPLPNVADLSITKNDSDDPVYVRDSFVYSLTVVNNGPFDTPSVQIVDLLPSSTVSVTDVTVTDGTNPIVGAVCSVDSLDWEVDCVIPYLEGGFGLNTAVINITTHLDPVEFIDDPTLTELTVTNEAKVFNAIATIDDNLSNNTATEDTTVKPWADLELIKSHITPMPPGGFVIGEQVVYDIRVQNYGPNTAQNAIVTDELPAGLEFESVTDTLANCVQAGNGISCPLDDLPENTTATIQLTARAIAENDSDTQTNTAVVSSPSNPTERDDVIMGWNPNVDDNRYSVDSPVRAPVLIVSKSKDGPGPGIVDQVMSYIITVFNDGPGLAKDVVITDTLYTDSNIAGLEVEYLGSELIAPGPPAAPPCLPLADGYTLLCNIGNLSNNESKQIRIDVEPNVAMNDMPNSVVARSNGGLIEASTAITTTVIRVYDLEVVKTGPESIDFNDSDKTINYSVVITNHGPSIADKFQVVDQLKLMPSTIIDTILLKNVGTNAACNLDVGDAEVTCTVTNLQIGFSTGFELEIIPDSPGTIDNTVTATDLLPVSGFPDNFPDSASVDTDVLPIADLYIDKDKISENIAFDDDGEVISGTIEYEISVTNYGPSIAEDVVITDNVTVGTITGITMTYQSVVCDSAPGGPAPISVSCALNSLAPNATAKFIASVTFTATVGPSLEDEGVVTSSTFDPGPRRNRDPEDEDITPPIIVPLRGFILDAQPPFMAYLFPDTLFKDGF